LALDPILTFRCYARESRRRRRGRQQSKLQAALNRPETPDGVSVVRANILFSIFEDENLLGKFRHIFRKAARKKRSQSDHLVPSSASPQAAGALEWRPPMPTPRVLIAAIQSTQAAGLRRRRPI